jgi:DNA modification methylase
MSDGCVICGVSHDPKEVCSHVEDVPIPHPRGYDRRWREMDEAPWSVIEGDCVEQMRAMEEASVDAIVTDPPYGLEFMGKEWDKFKDSRGRGVGAGHSDYGITEKGFHDLPSFGKRWTNKRCRKCGHIASGGSPCTCSEPVWELEIEKGTPKTLRAYQDWSQAWATEALRVLKPGGYLLAFGGTRTYHRLACAIEDAGFEIRDSLIWLYGSGFPKSLAVDKAIDKAAGAEREVVGVKHADRYPNGPGGVGFHGGPGEYSQVGRPPEPETAPATPEAQQWQGWGTALKPAHEPIVVARKPLIGTVAQNVLEHGTGAINVDGCRIGTEDNLDGGAYSGEERERDYATSYGPKRGIGEFEQPAGRWPANCVLSHLPECERVGTRRVKGYQINRFTDGAKPFGGGAGHPYESEQQGAETIPAYSCAPGCPVAELDRQSGELISAGGTRAQASGTTEGWGNIGRFPAGARANPFYGERGGASRFFATFRDGRSVGNERRDPEPEELRRDSLKTPDGTPYATQVNPVFRYQAKASRAERNAGLDGFEERQGGALEGNADPNNARKIGARPDLPVAHVRNNHPTVKPIDLMRWLVRLVTPPGGTVLDPFAGSGTTGIAATLEGFDFIGIEREAEYVEIARARIEHWQKYPQGTETEDVLRASAKESAAQAAGQDGLF